MNRLTRLWIFPVVMLLTACPGTSDSTDNPSGSPSAEVTAPASTEGSPSAMPTPKESIHVPKMSWGGETGKKAAETYLKSCMAKFKTPADTYCQCSMNEAIKMFPNPANYLALHGKLNEDQEQKIMEPCLSTMPEEKDQL